MSSRLEGKLKLAFTWSLISLARLLVIGPIIVGDLSMVAVSSSYTHLKFYGELEESVGGCLSF